VSASCPEPRPSRGSRLFGILILLVTAIAVTALLHSCAKPQAQSALASQQSGAQANRSLDVDAVQRRFLADIEGSQGAYGIAVIDIPTGTMYGVNGNRLFRAASVNKMPIVIDLYQQASAGRVSLSRQLTIDDSDIQRYGTGTIQDADAPRVYTLAKLADLTVTVSDNTAAFVLQRLLGQQDVQQRIRRWRLNNTTMTDNTSTAADAASLMAQLYRGSLLPPEATKSLLSLLQASVFPPRIAADIPSETAVAHKVGTDVGVYNDAGIVLLNNRPYAIAVFTEDADEGEADLVYARLSRDAYDFEASLITPR
jgi:beta-lactamase class A